MLYMAIVRLQEKLMLTNNESGWAKKKAEITAMVNEHKSSYKRYSQWRKTLFSQIGGDSYGLELQSTREQGLRVSGKLITNKKLIALRFPRICLIYAPNNLKSLSEIR